MTEKKRSYVLAGVCFLLLAGILWGRKACEEMKTKTEKTEYEIVCLGDSVLGQFRDEDGVVRLLEERTGLKIYNGAFGGTNMSRINTERSMSEQHDSLSMAALSEAIAYRDFGVQRTLRIKDNATEYFADTVKELADIDFSRVDILFIEHGTNDYNNGVPIDNAEDPYDVYSFGGALRSSIRSLRKAYPGLRIILMTPTYSWFPFKDETCETWNTGYGYLEDYVNKELQIGEEMGVEVIDNYHDLYPHETMEDWKTYTRDGLHLNEAGRRLLAGAMAEYIGEHKGEQ